MVRTSSVDEKGLKKGTWTEEEDRKLKAYIEKYGHWNWRQLPKFAGVARCGKSCRLRWMNYLRPGLKRGNYTKEEEDLIIQMHEKLGNKWSAIAAKLPGRTDNEVKNYWHTTLKRRYKASQPSKDETTRLSEETNKWEARHREEKVPEISQVEIFAAETSSFESSTTECSRSNLNSNEVPVDEISSFAESIESFWSEPFILDTSYNQKFQASLFDMEEGLLSFSSYLDDVVDHFGSPMD